MKRALPLFLISLLAGAARADPTTPAPPGPSGDAAICDDFAQSVGPGLMHIYGGPTPGKPGKTGEHLPPGGAPGPQTAAPPQGESLPVPAASPAPRASAARPLPPPPPAAITALDDDLAAARANGASPEDQRHIITSHAPAVVAALAEPPPPGVDPADYNRARNQFGQFLNRLGTDADRAPYQGSMDLANRVLADAPDDRDALNNSAGANYGLGRYREAVTAASKVAERFKDDERAYTTRALAYYQMKEYAQAYEDSQRALGLNPNNATAFQISKLAKPRITTPADLGLDAASKHAAEQVAKEYEGQLDERKRAESAAIAAARAPAKVDGPAPRRDQAAEALSRQATGRMQLGDFRGAWDAADRLVARDPRDPDALEQRAAAGMMLGDYEKAAADAGAALALKPDHVEALNTRAGAQLRLGRFHEALLDADRAVSLKASDPYAYKNRAKAKEGLGDLAGMLDDYRSAAKHGPQFDAELREAAGKYGLRLDAEGGAAPARPAPKGGRGRLIVLLAVSIGGGLLIAWGLLQAFMGGRKTAFSGVAGASPETAKALAAAGGLGAGYEIVRTLGNGGMGVVYEAFDKALERRVAVKKMRDEIRLDQRERSRFLQEARIVAQLHHPNIVEIHTIVSEGEDLYLVFEFVEGHTVDDLLARKTRFSVPEAQWVLHGVAKALEYAHAHNVVHRDLKPSNIMVEKDGQVKVMDFGIARQAKDALAKGTMTGTVAGTPQYMAPEQEEGVVRAESDVFSMGAMLYEMVTGQRPYPSPSTTASKLNKRYERPSRLRADLPPELEKLIDDCLEPAPEKRPRTAAEFRARLDALKAVAPAKSA